MNRSKIVNPWTTRAVEVALSTRQCEINETEEPDSRILIAAWLQQAQEHCSRTNCKNDRYQACCRPSRQLADPNFQNPEVVVGGFEFNSSRFPQPNLH